MSRQLGHYRSRLAVTALITFVSFVAGCTTETIQQEKMVVSPNTIIFAKGETAKTVSITHTCTCPFSWTATVVDPSATWLTFPASMSGDNASVPISFDVSKLALDSAQTTVIIVSNQYGADTMLVKVFK